MEKKDCPQILVENSAKTYLHRFVSADPQAASRPTVVVLPGGPGLSAYTVMGAKELVRSFNLVLVDPPGTGKARELEQISFENTIVDLEKALLAVSGPVVLVGHSYGGIYAGTLALRGKLDVSGVVLVATPTTAESWGVITENYETQMTDRLKQCADEFAETQTTKAFLAYLSAYGRLYFKEGDQAGAAWIVGDLASANMNLNARDWNPGFALLDGLRTASFHSLFISGSDDVFVTNQVVEDEAVVANGDFRAVAGAAHFVMRDNPRQFSRFIEEFVNKEKEVKE